MTGEQLKKSILQYAIEGKLVFQDDKEEPASILIEKIREEKERLIKEKIIRRDKNESFIYRKNGSFYEKIGKEEKCIDDELPFDIPDSWEWTRLGNIINLKSGQDLTSNLYSDEIKKYPYITGASNIEKGKIVINRWTDYAKNIAIKGDILISCKGTIGKIAFLNYDEVHIARQIMAIQLLTKTTINKFYIKNFLEIEIEYLKSRAKSMIPGISREDLLKMFIPIPPLLEQERIVAKIDELLLLVEKYNLANEELNNLNNILPEQLKKSLLQYAIQGKLVAQDGKDEPASILIEKIREEKERLIKEKIIKRDKEESFIYRKNGSFYEKIGKEEKCIDDELPFDIPDSWEWARLGSIAEIKGGKRIPKGCKVSEKPTQHIFLPVKCMKNGGILETAIEYIDSNVYEKIKNYTIDSCDLYITVAGTIGVVGEIPLKYSGANLTENADKIVLINKKIKKYLKYFISSEEMQREIRNQTTKVGQPKLAIKRIQKLLIPIPPLMEQERIVAKLEEILTEVEKLKKLEL